MSLAGPKQKMKSNPPPRERSGDKNLRYSEGGPDIQAKLWKTKAAGWRIWKQFNAGLIFSQKEIQELYVGPLLKSRLVGCGSFADQEGLQDDSPVGDVEWLN